MSCTGGLSNVPAVCWPRTLAAPQKLILKAVLSVVPTGQLQFAEPTQLQAARAVRAPQG